MFSLTRLLKAGYLLVFALVVFLLVASKPSQAQNNIGVSGGFRSTPGLPIIAFPVSSASTGGFGGNVGGGGFVGFAGGAGGGNVSGSFSTSIMTFNLGSLFPNHGQIIGLPPPTMMLPLNNFGYLNTFGFIFPNFFSFNSDSTGSPFALLFAFNLGGGAGMGGGGGGLGGGLGGVGGGGGLGGIGGGGLGGIGGGGLGGFGGGLTGFGGGAGGFNFGFNSFAGGGLGGFAGKGFGGFNGRKPL